MAGTILHNRSPFSASLMIWIASISARVLMATQSHSGKGKPPMFGDYEAQRHWMEVTLALPLNEWYHHTSRNDLQYWGLDYPPLTAYVSWFFGALAAFVGRTLNNPDLKNLVALSTSRGYESIESKAYMRWTVILCDFIILIPVLFRLSNIVWQSIKIDRSLVKDGDLMKQKRKWNEDFPHLLYVLMCVLCPALLLIDHGHFQYNGVCIGLALMATTKLLENSTVETRRDDIFASVLFCLSLNFKHMSLYYTPLFFF